MRSAVILALLIAASVAHATPQTVSFVARLADNGTPITGAHDFVFELYGAATGGTAVWSETRNAVPVPADGVLFLDLGSVTPLTPTVLDGTKKYLQITIDGQISDPRIGIESVPYAIRAGLATDSEKLQSHPASDFQLRVTGACPTGSSIAAIDATGGVTCQADTNTTYSAGTGLALSGTTFSVNSTLVQSRVNGMCATGALSSINADGSVTCLTAGTGLTFAAGAFNVDTTAIQRRVTGTCTTAITAIAADGTVTCAPPVAPPPLGVVWGRVDTAESRNANGYGDLPTAGPSATATIPASGMAMITVTGRIDPTSGTAGFMSFAGGGIAAADNQALVRDAGLASSTGYVQASATFVVTGITPGAQTFTAKYKGQNVTFSNRHIVVMPLP